MTTATATKPTAPPKLTAADKTRLETIADALQAYDGAFEPPLQKEQSPINWMRDKQTPDFNVIIPRSTSVVDTGLEFLFGDTFTVEVDTTAPNAVAAQQWLDQCWGDDDDRMTFFSEVGLNGFVSGHPFVKIVPPEDDDDYDEDNEANTFVRPAKAPEFIPLDPTFVTVCTDVHHKRKALGYQIRYQLGDGPSKINFCEYISRPNVQSEAWLIQDFTSTGIGENWTLENEQEWPYPFCPIQDCQNLTNTREYYGKGDLPPAVIGLNKALNLKASNEQKIQWHLAYPWPWFSGVGNLRIDPKPGAALKLPSAQSRAGVLAVEANTDGILQSLASLRLDMDEVTGVPSVATGRVSEFVKGQLSGVAIEMMYQRLIAKTIKKRRLYGKLIRKLCQIYLYFGGYDDTADTIKIKINWPAMLPIDELQSWQAAQLQDTLDVSRHSIYGSRGLNYDVERELKQQESQDSLEDYNAGQGAAPQAQQFMKAPLPGEQGQQTPGQSPAQPAPPPTPQAAAMQQAMKAAAAQVNAMPDASGSGQGV